MSRIRASLYVFCLEKASEALRNAEMADTHRDYEYWCGLEAKWNDLGDYYYRGEPKTVIDSAANPGDVTKIGANIGAKNGAKYGAKTARNRSARTGGLVDPYASSHGTGRPVRRRSA
jgi:hypothetical protein